MAVTFGLQELSIAALRRRDWLDTEMRVQVNQAKVAQYAEEMADGAEFPPPVAFYDARAQAYWVGDGFHRILAAIRNGRATLPVDVRNGGKFDAILHGITSNRQQLGMPFTSGDKKKCILTLAASEEGCSWSQGRIGEAVGASSSHVSRVIRDSGLERPATVVTSNGKNFQSTFPSTPRDEIEDRRRQTAELYFAGVPRPDIQSRLGVSETTLNNDLKKIRAGDCSVTCPTCHGTGKVSNIPQGQGHG